MILHAPIPGRIHCYQQICDLWTNYVPHWEICTSFECYLKQFMYIR